MSPQELAVRLIIDGAVIVPDVVVGEELERMRAGFERRAAELGKRWMSWEDICQVPELMSYILHPCLFAVVDAFGRHFGEEEVFANCSGARDVFDEQQARDFKPFDPTPQNLRHGKVGWHDDVVGMKNPDARSLPYALTSLLYLDDTFAHNGAYISAIGSHHLAYATADHKPVLCSPEVVLDSCELRPMPVKAGSVIIHRSHEWHAVVPVGQRRRLFLQTFMPRSVYDLQVGHTQVSDETLKLIPEERHQHLCWYANANA